MMRLKWTESMDMNSTSMSVMTMTMTKTKAKTKGHHGSLLKMSPTFTCKELLNMLAIGLVLVLITGSSTQVNGMNIASSSQFRSSLTSTTEPPPPSTTAHTTSITTSASISSSSPSSTTPVVPFTVSPTPETVSVAAPASVIEPRTGKRIQLANTPFIRLNRMNTGSRTNSRFLRTFPPLEYLEFARRESLAKHGLHRPASGPNPNSMLDHQMTMIQTHGNGQNQGYGHYDGGSSGSDEDFRFEDDSSGHDGLLSNQLGNSPIFYIKLPPAPYVLVPGLGYVSPHPYQNSNNLVPHSHGSSSGGSPMMMSPLGAFDFGGGGLDSGSHSHQHGPSSGGGGGSNPNNVISLPLKFVSNARPAIIVGAKPGVVDNGIHGDDQDGGKHTTLLSGGKYSFNGRPNGVFIVRSPAMSRTLDNNHPKRRQSAQRQRKWIPRT